MIVEALQKTCKRIIHIYVLELYFRSHSVGMDCVYVPLWVSNGIQLPE
jgi:hypothetical protein